jgi:hypothetical protein
LCHLGRGGKAALVMFVHDPTLRGTLMRFTHWALFIPAIALLLVSGCDTTNPSGEGAKPAAGSAPTASGQEQPSQPVKKAAGTRENPLPVGSTAKIGDWDVTVVKVQPNANAAIASENQFNDPPASGNQYVMATVQAKYVGAESGTFWTDMTEKFYGSGGNTFGTASVVAPNQISDTGETFPNATVSGNIVFAVPEGQLENARDCHVYPSTPETNLKTICRASEIWCCIPRPAWA